MDVVLRDRLGIFSTMLAFAPGEILTINGPMMTKYFAETKSSDFANLACPSMDVMVSSPTALSTTLMNKSVPKWKRKRNGINPHQENPTGLF